MACSGQHAVAREVLGHHTQLQQHLARWLRLQAEAVGLRGDDFLLLEARAAAKKEGCAHGTPHAHAQVRACKVFAR